MLRDDQHHEEHRRDDERARERELVHVRPRHAPGGEAAQHGGREVQHPREHRHARRRRAVRASARRRRMPRRRPSPRRHRRRPAGAPTAAPTATFASARAGASAAAVTAAPRLARSIAKAMKAIAYTTIAEYTLRIEISSSVICTVLPYVEVFVGSVGGFGRRRGARRACRRTPSRRLRGRDPRRGRVRRTRARRCRRGARGLHPHAPARHEQRHEQSAEDERREHEHPDLRRVVVDVEAREPRHALRVVALAGVGVACSKVTVPRPFGSSAVSPGFSSIESTPVSPPVSCSMPDGSSVYTEVGVPPSMPRSPSYTLSVSTGRIRSG